jgi:SPP1 family predicted phage head-tail adaptor
MNSMPAGKLDQRITIERHTTTQNEYGEEIESWVTYTTVWASKQDVSDRERIAASEVSAEITTRFVVRYSTKAASITPKDRIVFNDVNYNIFGVKEISRRKGLEITAAARVDGDV